MLKPKSYRCDKVPGSVNGNIKIALDILSAINEFWGPLRLFYTRAMISLSALTTNEHGKRSMNEKEWNIIYIPQLCYTSMDFNTSEQNGPIGLES